MSGASKAMGSVFFGSQAHLELEKNIGKRLTCFKAGASVPMGSLLFGSQTYPKQREAPDLKEK